MSDFYKALAIMSELFSKDYQFAIATSEDNIPSVRFIDTYFDGKYFYFVSNEKSQKVKEIRANPNVALSSRKVHSFCGYAHNIGHPLLQENNALRETLTKVFHEWYFEHNNEKEETMCYVRIEPKAGFFHKDGTGYKIDFENKSVKTFPFDFTVRLTEE
ncbi:MAG: pyridoxamine 5'-phosphate oxidase family protein [Clostridia bacterium]|nr:pyridoxamine 5'-phosphate oxidase family protein [Clostridia bacterium]